MPEYLQIYKDGTEAYPRAFSGISLTSEHNLDDIMFPMMSWCTNVQGRPDNTGTYGFFFMPSNVRIQMYFEYSANGVISVHSRYYTNNKWYPWRGLVNAPEYDREFALAMNYSQFAGYCPLATECRFTIPLAYYPRAASINLKGSIYIRQNQNTTAAINLETDATTTTYLTPSGITVRCVFSSTPSGMAAGACVVQPYNLTATVN